LRSKKTPTIGGQHRHDDVEGRAELPKELQRNREFIAAGRVVGAEVIADVVYLPKVHDTDAEKECGGGSGREKGVNEFVSIPWFDLRGLYGENRSFWCQST
jgi:hypothetical protein